MAVHSFSLWDSANNSQFVGYGATHRFSQPRRDFSRTRPSYRFQAGDTLGIATFRGFCLRFSSDDFRRQNPLSTLAPAVSATPVLVRELRRRAMPLGRQRRICPFSGYFFRSEIGPAPEITFRNLPVDLPLLAFCLLMVFHRCLSIRNPSAKPPDGPDHRTSSMPALLPKWAQLRSVAPDNGRPSLPRRTSHLKVSRLYKLTHFDDRGARGYRFPLAGRRPHRNVPYRFVPSRPPDDHSLSAILAA